MSDSLTPLDQQVRALITTHGPQPFDDVIRTALYDPTHGFYTTGGFAGRRGDFLTSPEVGPLFGQLIAAAIDREWDRLGQPSSFSVVDAGAGPGTLARSVHAAHPRCMDALTYVAVELSADQRAKHPDWVTSTATMPSEIRGVVLANELLDNLPFVPVERAAGVLRPASVGVDGGDLVRTFDSDRPVDGPAFPASLDAGVWQPEAATWLDDTLTRVLGDGRAIVIDYCRLDSADVGVRTYADHGDAGDPLESLGTKDITVDVDLEQLQRLTRPADAIETQANWLAELGLADLVEEGRAIWRDGAAVGDLAALRARSRVREAEALTDPTGLGGFTVAEWVVS